MTHPIPNGTAVEYAESSSKRAGHGYVRHSSFSETSGNFGYYITAFPWTPFDPDNHTTAKSGEWVYMFDYEIVEVIQLESGE